MRNNRKQTGLGYVLPVLLVTLMSCASAFSIAEGNQATEYRVKAAFLYNFSRFITWPEHARRGEEKFNLCILGGDPFGEQLAALSGKSVQKSPLAIKRLERLDQIQTCQIIFVSRTGASELAHIMSVLKDQPALTVSDMEEFTAHNGIIQFKLVDDRIRFDINIDAANHAGLTISSKLLSLATVVGNDQ